MTFTHIPASNGDATTSDAIKEQTIALIKADLGQVDAVIYSLASPRRTHPKSGTGVTSQLHAQAGRHAPHSRPRPVNTDKGVVHDITIEPANDQEIADTTAVMGGEDWEMWIDALRAAGVLADHALTVAYSYIGPDLTWAIYRNGTIGRAKEDLEATAKRLQQKLGASHGRAFVSINKALTCHPRRAAPPSRSCRSTSRCSTAS